MDAVINSTAAIILSGVSSLLGEHQPPLSSDSDTSIIMGVEVGISEIDLSTEQECEEAKS